MFEPRIASYKDEFGDFFSELPVDPKTGDRWFYTPYFNLVFAVHLSGEDSDDELRIAWSFDNYLQRGDDVVVQKLDIMEVYEKNGKAEIRLHDDNDAVVGVVPRTVFNEAHLLIPSLLRQARRSHEHTKAVRLQMEKLHV